MRETLVGKKIAMAAEATVGSMSSYFRGLNLVARNRYLDKLKYGKGTKCLPDPYQLSEGWIDSPRNWPDVTFGDIYVYLIETPGIYTKEELIAYKSLEAYKYVISGHVDTVYMHPIGSEIPYCFLKAKVKPSQRVSGAFHQPWVCIEKKTGSIYCAHCNCMAGLGETCSHVAAILFKVELAVKLGITTTSSTSEGCKWNKALKDEIEPRTIAEQVSLFQGNHKTIRESHNPTGFDPLPSIEELKELKEICPDACLFGIIPKLDSEETDTASEDESDNTFPQLLDSLFEEKFSSLEGQHLVSYVQEHWQRYHISEEQITTLEKQTRSQSINNLWHKHREGRITASKVHDVCHILPSTDPSNLVSRILGYNAADLSKVPAIRYGLDNESCARDWYSDQMEPLHENFTCRESGFYISKAEPFFGASPDGIVSCSCCGKGLLEIKWSFKNKQRSVEEAANEDSDFCLDKSLSLKPNHRYYSQVQFQMYVLQVKYCDFVIATDINKQIFRVAYDKQFGSNLASTSKKFFFNHVLPKIVTKKIYSKKEESAASSDDLWCICQKKASGKMIICAGNSCKISKLHYKCVDLRRKPRKEWFCKDCSKN